MGDGSPDAMGESVPPQETGHSRWKYIPKRSIVPFRSIRQAILHVTCLPKFRIWHMGEMTVTYIFFRQIFTIFFAIFKAFFTTSFYGFSTWPKWPLQPLHFGVFGVAVMCYCQIDRNGTVGGFSVYLKNLLQKEGGRHFLRIKCTTWKYHRGTSFLPKRPWPYRESVQRCWVFDACSHFCQPWVNKVMLATAQHNHLTICPLIISDIIFNISCCCSASRQIK